LNEQEPPPGDNFLVAAILFEAALVGVAVIVGWLFGHLPWETLHVQADDLPAIGWGVAATFPLLAGLLLIDRFPIGSLRHLKQTVARSVIPFFRSAGLSELALVSIAAGVGEEMFFRGVLQAIFTGDSLWSQAMALVIASLVFGACHWVTNTYAVLAALVGAYMGLLWIWTGNLIAPIICHALYDFLALCYLLRSTTGLKFEDPPKPEQ